MSHFPSVHSLVRAFGVAFLVLAVTVALTGCDSGGSNADDDDTRDIAETFTVTVQDVTSSYPYADQNQIGVAYAIGGEVGREIDLERGKTYEFVLDYTSNHPFYVGTNAEGAGSGQFAEGFDAPNGDNGEGVSVFFTVPDDAPTDLFYQCGLHVYMGGKMNVVQ